MKQEQCSGKLIIVSGPAGVGKGTLVRDRLFSEFKGQIRFSVSVTTRPPRKEDKEGETYFFINMQEFERRVANNEFLEYNVYDGNGYGTPKKYVTDMLNQGKSVILEIDVNGAFQVMKQMPECISIFVLPPSFEALESRMRKRGENTEESIQKRLKQAHWEISEAPKYQYQVVNGDIDVAYQELRQIYLKETGQISDSVE